jgi:branched-chain amino acid transport system substrate-binding protein
MKRLMISSALALVLGAGAANAQTTVKIGVLTDMSSLYADLAGPGSVAAARLAVADFLAKNPGYKVEIISGDHQNKPDVGSSIANQWYDVEKVDLIVDTPNSGVALAVKTGGDTWFFLTADYAFGHALERDTSAVVEANGGKVVGKVRHPLNTNDFSSFLLQAQSSKAKIIGLANAGGDTINSIKQAAEFGIVKGGQKLAGLLVFASDVNSLGLKTAQGLTFTETWYWDLNDGSREWTKRWQKERNAAGKIPTMVQAGVYAGVAHYLKAVAAVGSAADGKAVVAKMKEMPTDDPLFGKGVVRADGRKTHDAFLFEVKSEAESKYPGDIYKLLSTIPAAEAFRPLKDGGCPLVSG